MTSYGRDLAKEIIGLPAAENQAHARSRVTKTQSRPQQDRHRPDESVDIHPQVLVLTIRREIGFRKGQRRFGREYSQRLRALLIA